MKGLGIFDKIMFVVNSLVAFLLLLSYVLPFIPPKTFATLSVLSLVVPLLLILNILFAVFWLLKVKKQLLLSLVVLLLGYGYIGSLYKFSSTKDVSDKDNFTVMSFNVRLFNFYEWLPSKTIKEDIIALFESEQPDILSIQEYRQGGRIELKGYYDYNSKYSGVIRGGQTIFSKFPIINSGSLEFPNTNNNGIFIDVKIKQDTVRVYNIHLQSSGINTEVDALRKETSENLLKRLGTTFKAQQEQVELINAHRAKCPYKVIVTGDFNNTAYSYVYNSLKDDLVDTFEEAGNGFGKTFGFKFFPLRIDFILADKSFEINNYKSYDKKLSDHFPIKTTLKLNH
ncbi:endonuclease/exonuclease/phosphatase family protein [Winogradskyella sp. DF17]|uniref:Endonuclease/exonuclease/phosphatase family protein n=1 Tax=Winogradskyella pelagia TaxID=2819984 RepID=A0ABS3T449_9FLAO|nr:endonuclease/exonuclease/phosphatase family protein [Winogradskyella sp. DF17]MBO3116651.1 endonuclease/exonuclease/phosphatase family protein [Winogradskyella sp. DF17]